MRLTAILLLTACLQISARGLGQTLTLHLENAPLQQAFQEIERQCGYSFVYGKEQLSRTRPVNLSIADADLETVLKLVFKDQPLSYTISGNYIAIRQIPVLHAEDASPPPLPADIHGHVADSTGTPIQGANILIKGSRKGTVTDNNGNFDLKGVDNNAILIISYTGYETQQFKINGKNEVSIRLKTGNISLQDAVVNKGYYSTTQRLNTGDVSVVTAKEIGEQPVSDPLLALIGRVPGLDIQQTSGISGSFSIVRIRGINSIDNATAPYYLVDGVPFGETSLQNPYNGGNALGFGSITRINTNSANGGLSPFNALNPDDIESIEVLKDADATAIYGSKGANGVILITTKKGKAGPTRVNLDISQGFSQVPHFMNLLNTQQYLQVRREAFNNDGLPVPSIVTKPYDGNYDINGVWDTTRYTNWQKALIGGTADYTNVQAGVSGGNANTQFLISGGYYRNTTVFPGDYADTKGSIHFSLNNTSTNQRFHVQLTADYVNENNLVPIVDFTHSIALAPDAPAIYKPDGSINWEFYNGSVTFYNPFAGTANSSSNIGNNLISSLDMSYQILPGLILKGVFSYNHDELASNFLHRGASIQPPYNTDPTYRWSDFANSVVQTWNMEPQLNYTKKIANGTLSAVVVTTFQQNRSQIVDYYAGGFASDVLITNPAASSFSYVESYNSSLYRYNSAKARISYNWEEKYVINLTGNRDGSSRFGPGRQWANFGAIGAAWIFSKENMVANSMPWLSFGKLRASYGTTGNDGIGDYKFLSTYSPNPTTYQGVAGLYPNGLANPNFAWETDKKTEVALELGFLKDRVNLSASYYRSRTGNQLTSYPLPFFAGFDNIEYNRPAIVQNTSLEFSLNTVNIRNKDFTWTSLLTFTLPNNKLVAFPGIAQTFYATEYVVGKSLFVKNAYKYTGVNPQTGYYTVATKNANGQPSYPGDLHFTAPITQKYYGGFANSLTYKNFSLDIFIQFEKQIAENYLGYFNTPGLAANVPTVVLNNWKAPGDLSGIQKFGSQFSSTSAYGAYHLLKQSDGIYGDASFARLKNVALSYHLPAAWQQWAHMQNARIYFQAQNLLTVTSYLGLDPETGSYGLPPQRVVTFGISASF